MQWTYLTTSQLFMYELEWQSLSSCPGWGARSPQRLWLLVRRQNRHSSLTAAIIKSDDTIRSRAPAGYLAADAERTAFRVLQPLWETNVYHFSADRMRYSRHTSVLSAGTPHVTLRKPNAEDRRDAS
jgi:hypothetical protein